MEINYILLLIIFGFVGYNLTEYFLRKTLGINVWVRDKYGKKKRYRLK